VSDAAPLGYTSFDGSAIAEDAGTEALYEVLGKVGRQLGELEIENPLPYLLQRMSVWSGATLPRHDESRETFFPAPPDELVNSLKNMNSKSAWESLLGRTENLLMDRWFWLDLQYYATQAARGLDALEVAATIEEQTRKLDERLPDLKELKFNDGSAFASPVTRDWLVQLGQQSGPGGAGGEPDQGALLLSDMRQMGVDRFADAMNTAQEKIRNAGNARTAFQLRVAAARFCIEADQFYWAESLAESLVDHIEKHGLDSWEPELAGKAWTVLLEVARELKETDEAYPALERRAMKALAGLDLAGAGRFPKSRPVYS
ncbi:MAG: type VI secretion system domain-containing protein, partial [Pseudomonadales bacterium]|nr:type VI secretion system domain-containing protein [Pseudomonadales bacterium]